MFLQASFEEMLPATAPGGAAASAKSYFVVPRPLRCARVAATYAGAARDIPAARRRLMQAFLQLTRGEPAHAALYQREYLFRAHGRDYWLPIQSNMANEFVHGRRSGDAVDLDVALLGGHGSRGVMDWVFVVQNFDRASPASLQAQPR
jgi:hypothetical protein